MSRQNFLKPDVLSLGFMFYFPVTHRLASAHCIREEKETAPGLSARVLLIRSVLFRGLLPLVSPTNWLVSY